MERRALLIASQTGQLEGPNNEVNLLSKELKQWSFGDIVILKNNDASRQKILKNYEDLINRCQAEDAVLIYYSGHGGIVKIKDTNLDTSLPYSAQYIVPTDIDASTEDDFRGILDVELSDLLARLTDRTENVAVVLDCCHSARLSRNDNFKIRSLPRPYERKLPIAFTKRLAMKRRYPAGNPMSVGLSACGLHQTAVEYHTAKGSMGVLTESFLMGLRRARNEAVSWHTLGTWVREHVMALNPGQRPDLEGPYRRILFSKEVSHSQGVHPFFFQVPHLNKGPSLRAGRLQGVEIGNTYALLPPNYEHLKASEILAEVIVTEVSGGTSQLRIDRETNSLREPGLRAFPLKENFTRRPILLVDLPKSIHDSIDSSSLVMPCRGDEERPAIGVITRQGSQYLLSDPQGLPLMRGESGLVLENAERLARAHALITLHQSSQEHQLFSTALVWGRVTEGVLTEESASGTALYLGDQIYVSLANNGCTSLYLNLFYVNLDKSIQLLSHEQISGVEVRAGENRFLGYDPISCKGAWKMTWSDHLTLDQPRLVNFVVILSDRPQDLSSLESVGLRHRNSVSPSSVQKIMSHIGKRQTRNIEQTESDVRFQVHHLEMCLYPFSRPDD